MQTIEITVEQGNITTYDADVVALKYAQHFHGSDKAVATALQRAKLRDDNLQPPVGKYRYVDTKGSITARHALFVGTVAMPEFRYEQIREFAATMLQILADEAPQTRHVATTVHGAGYGLDEAEACLALFAGCIEALQAGEYPPALERISFVDLLVERVERFRQTLDAHLAQLDYVTRIEDKNRWGYRLSVPAPSPHTTAIRPAAAETTLERAGAFSETKPHAFVAMPFKKDMDDVFYYGIQQPVHSVGLLCERVDKSAFTGGIMEYVRGRIETASVVIAELSDANPNVYLEVGYAWGKDRPTILLVKDEKALQFDVRGQRCLVYERIRDLEDMLAQELKGMLANGIIRVNHAG